MSVGWGWNWRRGGRLVLIAVGLLMVVAVVGWAGTSLYFKIISMPTKQTEYMGLRLGMPMTEVLYVKGSPDQVGEQQKDGSWTGRAAENQNVKDFPSWKYTQGLTRLDLEFDKATKLLVEILCHSMIDMGCPPLLGLQDGMTEDDLVARLGRPNRAQTINPAKAMEFSDLGVWFYLQKQRIYWLGVRDYARKP